MALSSEVDCFWEGGQDANSGRSHSRSLIFTDACPFWGET
jgi:hypothetical protein